MVTGELKELLELLFATKACPAERLWWWGQVEEARRVEPDRDEGPVQPAGLHHLGQGGGEDWQELSPSRSGVAVTAYPLFSLDDKTESERPGEC